MVIKNIAAIVLNQELEGGQAFAYSQSWYNSRTIMLLEIETDTEITGWGECFGPAIINKSIIDNIYKPVLIGRDPFDSEVIWEELYNKLRDHGQKGLSVEAISAVDIALWDIKGKALKMPVYKLLGGTPRTRIMPYATGLYRRKCDDILNELVGEATHYLEEGFKAIKIKVGFGVNDDAMIIKEIRKAIGSKTLLMIDANHAYNASSALRLANKIEDYDIFWFEEPVPPEDIDGYLQVKAGTKIPIAGGEAEFTRYGFNKLLGCRAVDIVQPDCCVTGGISEFRKIATLASINNIQCFPHIWGSAVALAAGIHCAFSLPHFPPSLTPEDVLLELDRTPNIFRDKLSKTDLPVKDGYLYLPVGAGLSIEVDEDIIEEFKI